MKTLKKILGIAASKSMLSLLLGCQPVTSDVSATIIQDTSESLRQTPKLVRLSKDVCVEYMRTLPINSMVGRVDVTSIKAIPAPYEKLTSRRRALADCHQDGQTLSAVDVPSGTQACLGGEAGKEMLDKSTAKHKLAIVLIQANEGEKRACPEVWQSLAQAVTPEGKLVVVLSEHPLGRKLNEQIYQAVKDQTQVDFCSPEKAVACVHNAINHLKHTDNHVTQG